MLTGAGNTATDVPSSLPSAGAPPRSAPVVETHRANQRRVDTVPARGGEEFVADIPPQLLHEQAWPELGDMASGKKRVAKKR